MAEKGKETEEETGKGGDGGHRGKEAARKKLLIAHPY